jgi:SAM-dependent methyltransferase
MAALRKPWEGVGNIVRFNWHFYVLAAGFCVLLAWGWFRGEGWIAGLAGLALLGVTGVTLTSLAVSAYVYDLSGLYGLKWLDGLLPADARELVNLHAGFDESSQLLAAKFPDARLRVFDFYDPATHPEVSIERARKVARVFPGTLAVETSALPLADASVDAVFLLLAAHEIRDEAERVRFFRELHRALKPAGKLIVTEHLRDPANLLAYSVGAFHFLSRRTWQQTFAQAGFRIARETKITPFVTTFLLEKHGDAP